jgi:GcrA cell cycle regulator
VSEAKTARKVWNAKMEAECARLIEAEGFSSLEVARALNEQFRTALTRNAIIGKASRMGWAFSREGGGGSEKGVLKPRIVVEAPKPIVPKPPVIDIPRPVVSGSVPAIMALKTGKTCKYGIGDPRSPDFRFCMEATNDITRSYCPEHHALCCPPMIKRAA